MSITAITFEEFLAEIDSTEYDTPLSDVKKLDALDQAYPRLMAMGRTIEDIENFSRFDGVRQNLVREVRGGMCTAEQAIAYLENFELHLLGEAEKANTES